MAYALVQSNGVANDASATSIALAYGSNVVANNLLAHVIEWHDGTITITSITDTVGTSYAAAVTLSSGGQTIAIWYGLAAGSGANTVTVNFSATVTERRLCIHEHSGNATTSPLDNTASAAGTSTTPSSGAQTPSVDGCLVLGGVVNSSGGDATITAGALFTKRQDVIGGGGFLRAASEDYIQATAASVAADWTFSLSHDWLAVMAIFKPAAGGGGNDGWGALVRPYAFGSAVAVVAAGGGLYYYTRRRRQKAAL